MAVKENLKKLAIVGALAATASGTVLTGTASAAQEKACSGSYFCNITDGGGTYVGYVDAYRGTRTQGMYGFFEVFAPGEPPRTGVTDRATTKRFPIRKSYGGGLICLRFFEMVAGAARERGAAACTSIPIG